MRCRAVTIAIVASVIGSGATLSVGAQQLLLHFPLDGSPQAYGPAAGDARVYIAAGGASPTAVPGKFGQALRFDGTASIAVPFSLDAQAYPAVTVTAWVKVDAGSRGDRTVFSAGNGNVPKLLVNGDRANFVAARSALMFNRSMPRDEWVFVAGVVDVATARLDVHQGDGQLTKDGINTGNLYPPSSYRNPDDPSLPSQRYVFVGSHGFTQWPARQMAIDDVRVYAGAMTTEQVAALRTASSVESYAAAPATAPASSGGTTYFGGVLTDENVAGLSEAQRGTRPLDITYASEEEALAAAERREREAGQEELARQQNELEAQRRAEGTEPQPATGVPAPTGTPYPVGQPKFSAVAGHVGQNQQMLDLGDRFLNEVRWHEALDTPCRVSINGPDGSAMQLDVGCTDLGDVKTVRLSGSVIGSISVCSTASSNRRLKGIRVSGSRLNDDGSLTFVPASSQAYLPNCATWSPLQLCPVDPDYVATGVVVHSNQASTAVLSHDGSDRQIVGLQLICRQAGLK